MSEQDLIKVHIDDKEVLVPKGTNIIEAAARLGIEIPHYCYHPKLSVVGNCRMCLVEMGMPMKDRATGEPVLDEKGQPKIGWMPRPAIACATTATPGLQIRTNTPLVQDCRNGVMEFLLINHPLDCPICDQAGECRLQEFAIDYGRGYSRFIEQKVVKPKRTVLGPRVILDDERCILCSRCIRFCQEVAKDDVLGFTDRGSFTTLTCHPGKQLANNYSLNTVDICPVGALTSADFRFKMRVWFLKETRSICTESSVGSNTTVGSREGKIYRITPRQNDAVNDTWMADSGRALYKQVEAAHRLIQASVNQVPSEPAAAAEKAAEFLNGGKVAVVGSGHSSLEEQFLLRKLATAAGAVSTDLVAHLQEGDGLLISTDRTPNTRGALVTGLIQGLPSERLDNLVQAIEAGTVKTLLVLREDLTEAGLTPELLRKVNLIYIGTHGNKTAEAAQVVIPSLTVFEKCGSFINQQFRLQTFEAAVPGPSGAQDDLVILGTLLEKLGGENPAADLQAVWEALSREVSALGGHAYASIPPEGVALDPGPLADLPFPEGKTLHYEPKEAVGARG
jgi:NADH-quinone oxidoreductase subunit G